MNAFIYNTIGGIIIALGDIVWWIKEVLHEGMSVSYLIILTLFIFGNLLVVYSGHKFIQENKT